ncbi:acylneuraminate cytidylyltransferase family protein [Antarcticibacterium arcticum]|uniref:Acylneuraminate cytidylyltransferase family protein n=1 Tax=Antarcticibacterium arcticum TaxID=2585771 RepID=A0A5B8YJD8_9FLAO|nr:acylneuraminate cytidylyltransferase family protein [Antarcticibacterium arcticum]QED37751.1 acylneuraminate cytidylyltransferase family protein [Antarcticibacterium arcticum]
MRILGIIPARGGSKGVPGKNIMDIAGKPLISYAIEAGRNSSSLAKIIVSTEDKTIAKIARGSGCDVLLRSKELALDNSNVVEAVLEVLLQLEKENNNFDAVMLLQPTAPLRTGIDIDNAIELLKENPVDAIISMVPVGDNHPARMYEVKEGKMTSLMPQFETESRQKLPPLYIRNGCIYLIKTAVLKRERSFMPTSKMAYIMDPKWAVNIDTTLDVVILKSVIAEWKDQAK